MSNFSIQPPSVIQAIDASITKLQFTPPYGHFLISTNTTAIAAPNVWYPVAAVNVFTVDHNYLTSLTNNNSTIVLDDEKSGGVWNINLSTTLFNGTVTAVSLSVGIGFDGASPTTTFTTVSTIGTLIPEGASFGLIDPLAAGTTMNLYVRNNTNTDSITISTGALTCFILGLTPP